MSAQLLDGKAQSKTLRDELKQAFSTFNAERGMWPTLAVLRIGDDEASAGYARAIEKTCQGVGAGFQMIELPAAITQGDAVETIVDTYLAHREGPQEPFLAAYRRLGQAPFKEALYGRQ